MKRLILGMLLTLACLPAFAATCKISEYTTLARDNNGNVLPVPLEPRITSQTVTYTTSAQSSAVNNLTAIVRVVCDAKAHFRITAAGTNATVNDPFLGANIPEYFGIQPGKLMIFDFYDGTS